MPHTNNNRLKPKKSRKKDQEPKQSYGDVQKKTWETIRLVWPGMVANGLYDLLKILLAILFFSWTYPHLEPALREYDRRPNATMFANHSLEKAEQALRYL